MADKSGEEMLVYTDYTDVSRAKYGSIRLRLEKPLSTNSYEP